MPTGAGTDACQGGAVSAEAEAGSASTGPVVVMAACQVELAVGRPRDNAEAVEQAVREAAAVGAGLVVVPELATSGYVFESVAEARSLAEPPAM